MKRTTSAVLLTVMLVTACSTIRDSRINPFNWFGRDRSEAVETVEIRTVLDDRPLVGEVLSLNVDPIPEGAIIRAIGLPATQGFWDADLVVAPSDDPSRLVLEFRIVPPIERRRPGTQRSREVLAGTTISTARLEGVRSVTVVGRTNQRTVRR